MEAADYVTECICTDTIEHEEFKNSNRIKVISIAKMIADIIRSHESHEDIRIEYAKFR